MQRIRKFVTTGLVGLTMATSFVIGFGNAQGAFSQTSIHNAQQHVATCNGEPASPCAGTVLRK